MSCQNAGRRLASLHVIERPHLGGLTFVTLAFDPSVEFGEHIRIPWVAQQIPAVPRVREHIVEFLGRAMLELLDQSGGVRVSSFRSADPTFPHFPLVGRATEGRFRCEVADVEMGATADAEVLGAIFDTPGRLDSKNAGLMLVFLATQDAKETSAIEPIRHLQSGCFVSRPMNFWVPMIECL